MHVEVAPIVGNDLRLIADWIARDNPVCAVSFVRELRLEFRKSATVRCFINVGRSLANKDEWPSFAATSSYSECLKIVYGLNEWCMVAAICYRLGRKVTAENGRDD